MTRSSTTGELYRTYAAAMKNERENRHSERMLAGCIGGVFTALFMTPFDVVKIRLQAQHKPFTTGDKFVLHDGIMEHLCTCNGTHVCGTRNGNPCCEVNIKRIAWYKRPSHFNGTLDAFRKIVKNEGMWSLWSGLYPSVFISLPTVAMYYSTYDVLRAKMGYQDHQDSYLIPIAASGCARTLVSTLSCPFDVVRTKMQSEKMPPFRVFECVRTQVTSSGWLTLFLGLKPSLIRDVPFSMIYWSLLEHYRPILSRKIDRAPTSFMVNFIVGSLSGGFAAAVTLPFDVVKTQNQVELGNTKFAKQKSLSVGESLMAIWLKSGTKGLFAGFAPRLMRVMPACGIMLSTYEVLKRVLASV